MIRNILLGILISLSIPVFSQTDSINVFLEAGISPNSYKGDLSHSYSQWSGSYNIGLRFNHKKRINSRINLMFGNTTASNPYLEKESEAPNTFFKSSLFSIQYNLIINLIKAKSFNFYISPGIGLLKFDPKDQDKNSLADNPKTRAKNETYNSTCVMFPLLAGLKYSFPRGYGAGLEAGWLNPSTDYLDNISSLGDKKGNDNLLFYKLFVFVPLSRSK